MDEKMIAPQYVYVDENGKILGITSADAGVEVITEFNLSCALTDDGIPRYRWDGTQAVERTEEELDADRAAMPEPEPSTEEVLLELAADHEERLCMMELGI